MQPVVECFNIVKQDCFIIRKIQNYMDLTFENMCRAIKMIPINHTDA